MIAQPVAGFEREGHILDDDLLIAGRNDADTLDRQALGGRLQPRRRALRRQRSKQPVEALPALARGDKTLPVRDREIDRRQRPRAQDRARDDDARGRLLVNHQIGADPQHRRLQHHAHDLGGGAEAARDIAGALIAGQIILVGHAPAPGQASRHSHRDQHFGVAPAGGGEIVAARRQAHGLARGLARHEFGHDGQGDQDDARRPAPSAPIRTWKAKQIAR